MDKAAIDELQMHGQDIPWLLQHWAEKKPDHPALIWEPVDGDGRDVDLRRARRGDARPRGRTARPRHRARRQGPDPRRQLPRDAARLVGLRDVGSRGRHDQHAIGTDRGRMVHRSLAVRRRDHAASSSSATSAPRPVTSVGSRSSAIAPTPTPSSRSTTYAATAHRGRAAPSSRCARSGSCSPRARPTSRRPSCTRTPTRCGRAASARGTSTCRPTTAT